MGKEWRVAMRVQMVQGAESEHKSLKFKRLRGLFGKCIEGPGGARARWSAPHCFRFA